MIKNYFADFHVHIGRTKSGKPVKISGSKNLTLHSILEEASLRKGLDLIGIIDCHVPEVLDELEELIRRGEAEEQQGGGIRFQNTTLLLGTEMEVNDAAGQGPFHVLGYFPTVERMRRWSQWMARHQKNIHLSSQRIYAPAKQLQKKLKELEGIFIPAHIFTPFKSLYGKGVHLHLTEVLDPSYIDAVELGLSSDTQMANQIPELLSYPYLTNSDAHSLSKIGREYQILAMEEPSFAAFVKVLREVEAHRIIANYGLNPKLGKYHHEVVERIQQIAEGQQSSLGGEMEAELTKRNRKPPYIHQIPLEYIPKLGKKSLDRLIQTFGSEMNVLHSASRHDLEQVISKEVAEQIMEARQGNLVLISGGKGKYGKVSYGSTL